MSDVSRVEEIFLVALEQTEPDQRAKYLDAACAGDVDLRRRVEELLVAQPKLGRFLEPHQRNAQAATMPLESSAAVGDRVGPYKLLERIGEGGMGEVWVADQQEPIKRRVALKLIKPGMDSRSVLARFEAERQALAVMDHPNIAKVLDAGTTKDGRPYFVMELVKGTPITEFAEKARHEREVQELRWATRLQPSVTALRTQLAKQLVRLGRFNEAMTVYDAATKIRGKLDPEEDIAWELYGMGQVDKARELLEAVIRQSDETFLNEVYALLGVIHTEQGRRDMAFECFRDAYIRIHEQEDLGSVMITLGGGWDDAMQCSGTIEQVVAAYQSWIGNENCVTRSSLSKELGEYLTNHGKLEEAVAIYLQALSRQHGDKVHYELSRVLVQLKRPDDAIAVYDITHILNAIDSGDPQGSAELLPFVYAELRKLAAARLAGEKPGQTLDPTGLVHEAYLRLVGNHRELKWDGRGHFFASAAEAMRRILIENARRKQGPRRGGDRRRVDADLDQINAGMNDDDLLDLDEALEQLAAESPIRAELVKLRFFAGLTIPECAAALDISTATAERYWAYARVRLYAALADPAPPSERIDTQ